MILIPSCACGRPEYFSLFADFLLLLLPSSLNHPLIDSLVSLLAIRRSPAAARKTRTITHGRMMEE